MATRRMPLLTVLALTATAAESQAPVVRLDQAKQAYRKAMEARPSKSMCDACVWWHKVEATLDLANSYMYSPELLPKDKYPNALRHYREALRLSATLKEAQEGADTIVSIYQGMGRAVPE